MVRMAKDSAASCAGSEWRSAARACAEAGDVQAVETLRHLSGVSAWLLVASLARSGEPHEAIAVARSLARKEPRDTELQWALDELVAAAGAADLSAVRDAETVLADEFPEHGSWVGVAEAWLLAGDGGEEARRAVSRALGSPDEAVRRPSSAAWVLGRLDAAVLPERLAGLPPGVRAGAARVRALLRPDAALPTSTADEADSAAAERAALLGRMEGFARARDPAAIAALRQGLQTSSPPEAASASWEWQAAAHLLRDGTRGVGSVIGQASASGVTLDLAAVARAASAAVAPLGHCDAVVGLAARAGGAGVLDLAIAAAAAPFDARGNGSAGAPADEVFAGSRDPRATDAAQAACAAVALSMAARPRGWSLARSVTTAAVGGLIGPSEAGRRWGLLSAGAAASAAEIHAAMAEAVPSPSQRRWAVALVAAPGAAVRGVTAAASEAAGADVARRSAEIAAAWHEEHGDAAGAAAMRQAADEVPATTTTTTTTTTSRLPAGAQPREAIGGGAAPTRGGGAGRSVEAAVAAVLQSPEEADPAAAARRALVAASFRDDGRVPEALAVSVASSLAAAVRAGGDPGGRAALAFVEALPGVLAGRVTERPFTPLLGAMAQRGLHEAAERVAGAMESLGVALTERSLGDVARSLANGGLAKDASAWLRRAVRDGISLQPHAVGAVAEALAADGQARDVRRLLRFAEEGSTPLTSRLFCSLLRAHAVRGDAPRCRAVLAEMRRRGLERGDRAHAWAIHACAVARDGPGAEAALLAATEDESDVTAHMLTAVADAYASSGRPAAAERVADFAAANYPSALRLPLVHAVLKGLARSGDAAGAEGLVADTHARPGCRPTADTVAMLVAAYAGAADGRGAIAALGRAEEWGVRPGTRAFNSALLAQVAEGSLRGMKAVVSRMRAAGVAPDVVTFTLMARLYSDSGSLEGAEAVLDRARASGVGADTGMYFAVLRACAAAGDEEAGERVLARMRTHLSEEAIDATLESVDQAMTAAYGSAWAETEALEHQLAGPDAEALVVDRGDEATA